MARALIDFQVLEARTLFSALLSLNCTLKIDIKRWGKCTFRVGVEAEFSFLILYKLSLKCKKGHADAIWSSCDIRRLFIIHISFYISGYLLLSEATPSDSGMYQCVVTNVAGVATTDAKVLVTGRVKFRNHYISC